MMEILKRIQEDDQSFGKLRMPYASICDWHFTADDPCSGDTGKSLEERLNGLDLGNEVLKILHDYFL